MEAYKKTDLAVLQLNSAIKLYLQNDFVSALTLAGAANEVLANLCRARGLPWSHNFDVNVLDELLCQPTNALEKFTKRTLNKTRNELKHQNSDEDYFVEAEFWAEAIRFISSAVNNYKTIFGQEPQDEIIQEFLQSNFEPLQGR